jgi:hypothetical protein
MLARAAALMAALLMCVAPAAHAAVVQVTVEVPQGKTKTVRLRKLPKGTRVAVSIRTDGGLRIALVSAAALKSARPEALFRAAVDRSLSFAVVIPVSSDYYLVLDNRRGTEPVKARATIQARRGPGAPGKPPPADAGGKLEGT